MRSRFADDSGARVLLVDPTELLHGRRYRADARLAVHIRRVARGWRGRTPRVTTGVFLLLLFGPMAWSLSRTIGGSPGPREFGAIVAGALAGSLLMGVETARGWGRAWRVFAYGMLEEGICPACEYNFAGLAGGAAGSVICPECGAAWRAERIVRALPERAATTGEFDLRSRLDSLSGGWDHRGEATVIQPHTLNSAMRWAGEGPQRERLAAVRDAVMARGRAGRIGCGLAAIAAAGAPFVLLREHLPPGAWVFAVTVALVLGPVIWFGSSGRGGVRRVRRMMLAAGLCPSCGGDLRGVAPGADGCRGCPVCRSAWRLPGDAAATLDRC